MHRPAPQAPVRINRFLSMCGISSRRSAEELVLTGRVSLNGKRVADLATRVDTLHDRVRLDGKEIRPVSGLVYLVLNKPRDAITSLNDERGRRTVMEFVHSQRRVFPVGRLDRNTTGVLLLTNDGEFAHRLMHPRRGIPKSYHVTCDRPVRAEHARRLAGGVDLDDGRTAPADVVLLPAGRGSGVGITITEGKNRQVRRMFEHLGYQVVRLDRVAYGPVTKRGLARGEIRSLTRQEIHALRLLAGIEDIH
jgi:23S rRNA pseudouridine2605 synthase